LPVPTLGPGANMTSHETNPRVNRTPKGVNSGFTINTITRASDLRAVEDLQVLVWGFGPLGVVPSHVLHAVGSTGGILLGATVRGELVGFVLGFLGRSGNTPCHMSHMLGIRPDFQGQGLGEALKRHQRERAREQGLDLMTWTFDPLEARNAHFNLHKLGAVSGKYCENLYGDLGDRLNHGLPTDRLVVEWPLGTSSLPPLWRRETAVSILDNVDGRPSLHLERMLGREPLMVAIPDNIQELKEQEPATAMEWRLALREALTWSFIRGYAACDVLNGAYILTVN
jgi:predicted GNAT superfamily acetyltransferase